MPSPRKLSKGTRISIWIGVAAIIATIAVGVYSTYVAHKDSTHDSKPSLPVVSATNGPQSATSSGAGPATNNAANGSNSHIGNGDASNSNNNNVNIGGVDLSKLPKDRPIYITINNFNASPKVLPSRSEGTRQRQYRMYFNLAVQNLIDKKMSAAIVNNTHAIKINPKPAATYNNRAIARFSSGDYLGAVSDWETASKLEPFNSAYHQNLAKALSRYAVGRKDAFSLTTQSISEDYLALNDPANTQTVVAFIWCDIGAGYMQIGKSQMASQAVNKALQLNPECSNAHSLKATFLLANGDEQHALDELKVSLLLNPDDSLSYWSLAEYYAFTRPDRDKAYFNLSKALSLDPSLSVNFHNPNASWRSLCNEPRFRELILKDKKQ